MWLVMMSSLRSRRGLRTTVASLDASGSGRDLPSSRVWRHCVATCPREEFGLDPIGDGCCRIWRFGGEIAMLRPCCGLLCAKMSDRIHIPEKSPEKSARLLNRSLGVIAFAIASANCAAFAGDAFAPTPPSPDQARCDAIGEGFYAVKGSNACIKISGYVAAGADFAAPGAKATGAFAPRPDGGLNSQTAVSADVRVDTPLGPGRLYVQFGHDSYRP